jgi:glycosyltransferase involved in cell wall biosynthesis
LRVAVDGRSLGGARRGIAHYTSALLEALTRLHPEDEYVVVPGQGRASYLAGAVTGRPRLDRLAGGCDVFWAVAPAPLAVSRSVPLVLTVHDRSWEERPQDFTVYERLWHRLARPRALARRAARVLTTTEVGAHDVTAAWGLDPGRVRAVPLAPAVAPVGEAEDGEPYFLFPNALEPRKAPDVLVAAVRRARPRGLRARVVVVGEGRVPVPGLERVGRVTDEALSRWYAGALAVVVPSRLEGFGLPAVEALAHGTPVIVTDLREVREVLGAAATYVPVDDPDALADALLRAEARPARADPGAVAHLTWDATARGTRAALAEAAGG